MGNHEAIVTHLRTTRIAKRTLTDGRPLEDKCATLNEVMRDQAVALSLCLLRTLSGESFLYRRTGRPVLVFDLGYTDVLDQLTYFSILQSPWNPLASPGRETEYTDVPAKVFVLRTLAEALLSCGYPHEALLCLATTAKSDNCGYRIFERGALPRAYAISQVQHLFILLHEIAHYMRLQKHDTFRPYEWLATTSVERLSEMVSEGNPLRPIVEIPDVTTSQMTSQMVTRLAVRAIQDLSDQHALIELQCDLYALTELPKYFHLTGVQGDDDILALHTLRLAMAAVSEIREAARDYARGVHSLRKHDFDERL